MHVELWQYHKPHLHSANFHEIFWHCEYEKLHEDAGTGVDVIVLYEVITIANLRGENR